jgi:hypothetical protein
MASNEQNGWRVLIIGECILSRVYQLNIKTPPYATNISECFIVHSLHKHQRTYNEYYTVQQDKDIISSILKINSI